MALIPLVDTVENPAVVVLEKEMAFRRRAVFRISGVLANAVVAVALAWLTRSVDALVAGAIAGATVHTLVSHVIVPRHPLPSLDREQIASLLGYGKWLTGHSIVSWLSNEGDDVLVGAVVGSSGLAFYRSAYQFGQSPQTEITSVINNVAFPAYAEVRDDRRALTTGYRRTLGLATLAVFPAAIGMALVAPVFIPVVLGPEWTPVVVPLQLVSFAAVAHSFAATAGSIWQAVDRPDLLTKTQFLGLALLAITVVPATVAFGITGTAAGVALVGFLLAPVRIGLVARTLDAPVSTLLRPLVAPTLATAGMSVVVVLVRDSVPSTAIGLAAAILSGVVSYTVLLAVLDRTRLQAASPIREVLGAVRS